MFMNCCRSVDDLVEAIVLELGAQGMLNTSYIFYSSDNGVLAPR
jgi:arylsulfatase A-like enzyme